MDFSQTKTVEGLLPFAGLTCSDSALSIDSSLNFDVLSPIELAEQKKSAVTPQGCTDLVELAACAGLNGLNESTIDDITSLAERTGPLFALSDTETMRDWAYAACTAHFAVRLQECLNESSSPSIINEPQRIKRYEVHASDDPSARLTLFQTFFNVTGAYAERLDTGLPLVRRSSSGRAALYTFVTISKGPAPHGPHILEVTIFRFEHELSISDFGFLKRLLQQAEINIPEDEMEARLVGQMPAAPIAREQSIYALSDNAQFDFTESRRLEEADADAMTALVQALASAHLGGVQVDIFRGTQNTGFLSFECYLSYLWFDFAHTMETVTIGYCEQCRKAYSLKDHRGIERRYCSTACKTKAKNERARSAVARIRAGYLEGRSIEELAEAMLGSTSRANLSAVRKKLSSWPILKKRLEIEIDEKGWNGSELYARCVADELDIEKMLHEKQLNEWWRRRNPGP